MSWLSYPPTAKGKGKGNGKGKFAKGQPWSWTMADYGESWMLPADSWTMAEYGEAWLVPAETTPTEEGAAWNLPAEVPAELTKSHVGGNAAEIAEIAVAAEVVESAEPRTKKRVYSNAKQAAATAEVIDADTDKDGGKPAAQAAPAPPVSRRTNRVYTRANPTERASGTVQWCDAKKSRRGTHATRERSAPWWRRV